MNMKRIYHKFGVGALISNDFMSVLKNKTLFDKFIEIIDTKMFCFLNTGHKYL